MTGENRLIVKIKKSEEKVGNLDEQITAVLDKEQADQRFSLESKSEIGSSTSADLRNKAIMSDRHFHARRHALPGTCVST